jgi:hypothetical protein
MLVSPAGAMTAEVRYPLDHIAAGTYLYEVQNIGGLLQQGKLVLIKR